MLLWHESGAVIVVSIFPDHDDFIDGDVAEFPVRVAQVEHTCFDLNHLAAQARVAEAVNVNLFADEFT